MGGGVCSSGVSVQRNGLEAARITLCASKCSPSSHARVTSVNSLSSRNLPKAELIFSLKSFHLRQSFSDIFFDAIDLYNLLFYKLNKLFIRQALASPKLISQKICCFRKGIHKKQSKITLVGRMILSSIAYIFPHMIFPNIIYSAFSLVREIRSIMESQKRLSKCGSELPTRPHSQKQY